MNPRILVVCTANVCRSPFAERLLRARLGGSLFPGLVVLSAGTNAALGHDGCRAADRMLSRLGADPAAAPHRPGPLTRELIDQAHLVLTADRAHRSVVAALAPDARSRTFTLREACALASAAARAPGGQAPGAAGAGFLPAFAEELHRARGLAQPVLDIPDGHGFGTRRHRQSLRLVDEAVAGIASALILAVDQSTREN